MKRSISDLHPNAMEDVIRRAVNDIAKAAVHEIENLPVEQLAELRSINSKQVELVKNSTDISKAITILSAELKLSITTTGTTIVDTLTKTSKIQSLQWGMSNAAIGAFEYYSTYAVAPGYQPVGSVSLNHRTASTATVLRLLGCFLGGSEMYIEGSIHDVNGYHNGAVVLTPEQHAIARTAFQKALCDQVQNLIGKRPTLKTEADGRFALSY